MSAALPKALAATLQGKGWKVYERPFELNIVGIRSKTIKSNSFDDTLNVFWKDDTGNWHSRTYPCTTDPGTFWLNNPRTPSGTAFLVEGQYPNAYQIGLHQGKYKALTQRLPVSIVRGIARTGSLLSFPKQAISTGFFGINIHRANRTGTTFNVDRNSAGCQVLAKAEDFAELMKLADIHAKRYGNSFTYTLLDFRVLRQFVNLKVSVVLMVLAAALSVLGFNLFGDGKQ